MFNFYKITHTFWSRLGFGDPQNRKLWISARIGNGGNAQRWNIPFREFIIKDFKEEALGELLSYFMLETAIIGQLANINPFNQPAVEQVKINTKKLLF